MRRFELRDDKSSKFWEVSVEGSTVTVRFGKIGTNGQTQAKAQATPEKAKTEHDKLVKEKTGKGYVEVTTVAVAPSAAVPAPAVERKKAKGERPAKVEEAVADEPGWIDAPNGYRVALLDGKIACRNAKGNKLASVPKELKESDAVQVLEDVRDWLVAHDRDCIATVERWMLRSLPAPRAVLQAVWEDPSWRRALENAVVVPVDESGKRDDSAAGFFRGVDPERGIGLVTLDGETVWTDALAVAIPHPILIRELDDFRALAGELAATQGISQLVRETYEKPAALAKTALSIRDFVGGEFEQLNHALGLCRRLGYQVSGGSALMRVWESGKVLEARLWIGSDDPMSPAETDELSWVDDEEHAVALGAVTDVAFSEGMRMGSQIFAGRKIPKEGDHA